MSNRQGESQLIGSGPSRQSPPKTQQEGQQKSTNESAPSFRGPSTLNLPKIQQEGQQKNANQGESPSSVIRGPSTLSSFKILQKSTSQGESSPSVLRQSRQSPPKPARLERQSSKYRAWMRNVFWTRKQYIPGDTCRCFWQKTLRISKWYVVYRVAHMLLCLGCIMVSYLRIHTYSHEKFEDVCLQYPRNLWVVCPQRNIAAIHMNMTWPFYLTRWGLMGNFAQAVMGLAFVLRGYIRQWKSDNDNQQTTEAQKSKTRSKMSMVPVKSMVFVDRPEHSVLTSTGIYWAMHSGFLTMATVITIMYWSLLWTDKTPLKLIVQTVEHALNSILMITDYALVAFPLIMPHILLILFVLAAYAIVNFIYVHVGGVNQEFERNTLYKQMDWLRKPQATIIFIAFQMTVNITFYCLYLLIDHFKFKYRPKAVNSGQLLQV